MDWERQTGESYQAFAAFQTYLTTAERSYPKVARALQKSTTLIKRWAKKYRWRTITAATPKVPLRH